MKFTAAIATAILGTTSVSALPSGDKTGIIDLGDGVTLIPRKSTMQARRAARKASMHSLPDVITNNSNVEYSSNWAGAVLVATDAEYTDVAGTFTVPTPSVPSGGTSNREYSASAWVGIDGDTCETAILQTGIDFNVRGSSVSYDAWYEWYPDYAYDFSGITISAGDSISLTASATSKRAGTVTIENVTTGKTVTHSFTRAETEAALCEYNAEWIVEDYESGGSLVAMADFGTVVFTDISPSASGATIIDIEQDNEVLTTCAATAARVRCVYSG